MRGNQQTAIELPAPDADMQKLSDELLSLIKQEINEKGAITFSRFMQKALYEPGYGYYMNGLVKFGAQGDFITAPEVSPLFSRCVAIQCGQLIQGLTDACILELGAGSGVMAADILRQLDAIKALPEHYYILELSASLRQRQQQTLSELPEHIQSRVQWLDSLEGLTFSGVVLGNEVLDALPVERFLIQGEEVLQSFVNVSANGELLIEYLPASDELRDAVRHIEATANITFSEGYCSEICLQLKGWINAITQPLKQGMVLMIDYGYPRAEYYHPQREMGTLLCHYRHRAHDDVLRWAGLQDITAQVDFTAVAEAAEQPGLQVAGYTHQASFLLDSGIEQLLTDMTQLAVSEQLASAQQIKTLLLPTEMGERFKVMALLKGYEEALLGFSHNNDRRHYL